MNISKVSAAIYARVSSDAQAQEQTIDSQVADLRQRVTADGAPLDDANCFLDEGVSGSTLHRPALEKLRDAAYVGGFKRLYVHSPDRLARKYAYQVLIVDELQKQGIEIVFLNRAIGTSHRFGRPVRSSGHTTDCKPSAWTRVEAWREVLASRTGGMQVLRLCVLWQAGQSKK